MDEYTARTAILIVGTLVFYLVAIWFVERVKQPPEEPTSLPESPCGNDKEHAYWVGQDFPCPLCSATEDDILRKNEEERNAKRLARYIAASLNNEDIDKL